MQQVYSLIAKDNSIPTGILNLFIMSKQLVITGTILILVSIILGAMAAHALEKIVSFDLITTF